MSVSSWVLLELNHIFLCTSEDIIQIRCNLIDITNTLATPSTLQNYDNMLPYCQKMIVFLYPHKDHITVKNKEHQSFSFIPPQSTSIHESIIILKSFDTTQSIPIPFKHIAHTRHENMHSKNKMFNRFIYRFAERTLEIVSLKNIHFVWPNLSL